MKRNMLLAALSCASAIALAACDGGGSSLPPPPVSPPAPPPVPAAFEDQFGPGFGPLFRAFANTDPADPTADAIIAVDVTRDPLSPP